MSTDKGEIDEGLYSRQLYVLGHDAMKKMHASHVLISGMGGVGIEIAKNVALGGVKSITIHDTKPLELRDLSSQFFCREEEVGKNRAEACCARLAELNPYVPVKAITGELTDDALAPFSVVVLTDSPLDEQLRIDELCRASGKACIVAETNGLFGHIFCDFGPEFVVSDTNGEKPLSVLVSKITRDADGCVMCNDNHRHGFSDGDMVTFTEVQGMVELNDGQPRTITVKGPYTFSIGDTSGYSEHTLGGIATQVKQPVTLKFKSLRDNIADPEMLMSDFAKFDRPLQLHVAYLALDEFKKQNGGRAPEPGNAADADAFLAIFNTINDARESKAEVSEDVVRQFASQATAIVAPLDAVIGGVTAQEVMKACSGKFTPIMQHFYFDSLESLPESGAPTDVQPIGSRYDGLIAAFGQEFLKKLRNQRYFVVGAGAIGCELLKNFSMLGLGSQDGMLYVTDMDIIEKSNLNRQFLFRPNDVKKLKSETAAVAVREMNPDMNIVAHANKVGPETEAIYNDQFFESLNGVANALDNVEARKYVDLRCVFFEKPLLESGTLGTKGNVQVVLPHKTLSYSSTQDPPEKSIPICTLKTFPYRIEHTLQWARDLFEALFTQQPENVNRYLTEPDFADKVKLKAGAEPVDTLKAIKEALVTDKPATFEDCVAWAVLKFSSLFRDSILQLVHNFPEDRMTDEGVPFWSGTKRFPSACHFNPDEPLHFEFVKAAANLRAHVFGIETCRDASVFAGVFASIVIPDFAPKEGVKIAADEKEKKEVDESYQTDSELLSQLLSEIPPPSDFGSFRATPEDFEKDDDANFHMDFITAASNLRATNYKIDTVSKHESKQIAGRIIPAIATTTAFVAGLVGLELCKLVNGNEKLESYKDGFANLALPFFGFGEPQPCPKKKYNDTEFTLWDRINIKGSMTLQQLISFFEDEHSLEVTMVSCGVAMIYSFFMQAKKKKDRINKTIKDLIVEVTKRELPDTVKRVTLDITCDDEDGEDVEIPFVVVEL